jgi:hypothetical protein
VSSLERKPVNSPTSTIRRTGGAHAASNPASSSSLRKRVRSFTTVSAFTSFPGCSASFFHATALFRIAFRKARSRIFLLRGVIRDEASHFPQFIS